MFEILKTFVDESKLAGWVRAGVAAGLGYMAGKGFQNYLSPEMIDAAGVLLSGLAVAVWSHLAKSPAAPVKFAEIGYVAPKVPSPVTPAKPVA